MGGINSNMEFTITFGLHFRKLDSFSSRTSEKRFIVIEEVKGMLLHRVMFDQSFVFVRNSFYDSYKHFFPTVRKYFPEVMYYLFIGSFVGDIIGVASLS
jgi:hypothetical protein